MTQNNNNKLNIKGNKKDNSSLDDLARQTAVDDKELIKDLLSGKKVKPKSKTPKPKIKPVNNIDPISEDDLGSIIYSVNKYNQDNFEVNGQMVLSATYQFDLQTKQNILLTTAKNVSNALKWVTGAGLFQATDDYIKKIFNFKGEYLDSKSKVISAAVNTICSMEFLPRAGLLGAYDQGVMKLTNNVFQKEYSLIKRVGCVAAIKTVNQSDLYYVKEEGFFGQLMSDLGVAGEVIIKNLDMEVHDFEHIPGFGFLFATTDENNYSHILRMEDKNLFNNPPVKDLIPKFEGKVSKFLAVPGHGVYYATETDSDVELRKILQYNQNSKEYGLIHQVMFSLDQEIIAMEYVPKL